MGRRKGSHLHGAGAGGGGGCYVFLLLPVVLVACSAANCLIYWVFVVLI